MTKSEDVTRNAARLAAGTRKAGGTDVTAAESEIESGTQTGLGAKIEIVRTETGMTGSTAAPHEGTRTETGLVTGRDGIAPDLALLDAAPG